MSQGYDHFFEAAKSVRKGESLKKKKLHRAGRSNKKIKRSQVPQLSGLKKRKRQQRHQSSGWAIILLASGCILTAWGVLDPSGVLSLLDQVEVGWLSQVGAADSKSGKKGDQSKSEEKEKPAHSSKAEANTDHGAKEQWDSEGLSYFKRLSHRKKELDAREEALNDLEAELHKQKSEIESRLRSLDEMRRKIASVLQERVKVDEEKVKKLVDVYSNMKPKQAADVMSKINEDLAVEILGNMKKKSAADILNLLDAKKARTLTEKYAGYQRR